MNNKGMERKLGNSGSIESPNSSNINFCPPFDCMLEDILPPFIAWFLNCSFQIHFVPLLPPPLHGGKSITSVIRRVDPKIETFLGPEMATHVHEITKVTVFSMALGFNDFDGGIFITWAIGRVGPCN
jgi:hypothetical protein